MVEERHAGKSDCFCLFLKRRTSKHVFNCCREGNVSYGPSFEFTPLKCTLKLLTKKKSEKFLRCQGMCCFVCCYEFLKYLNLMCNSTLIFKVTVKLSTIAQMDSNASLTNWMAKMYVLITFSVVLFFTLERCSPLHHPVDKCKTI